MSSQPNIKAKVDELFLRWFNKSEIQQAIHCDLQSIVEGNFNRRFALISEEIIQDNQAFRSCSPTPPSSPSTLPCSPRSSHSSTQTISPRSRSSKHKKLNLACFGARALKGMARCQSNSHQKEGTEIQQWDKGSF